MEYYLGKQVEIRYILQIEGIGLNNNKGSSSLITHIGRGMHLYMIGHIIDIMIHYNIYDNNKNMRFHIEIVFFRVNYFSFYFK